MHVDALRKQILKIKDYVSKDINVDQQGVMIQALIAETLIEILARLDSHIQKPDGTADIKLRKQI